MKPDNDNLKQVTLEDVDGFTRVVFAIFDSESVSGESIEELKDTIHALADDIPEDERSASVMRWLPKALGVEAVGIKKGDVRHDDIARFGRTLEAVLSSSQINDITRGSIFLTINKLAGSEESDQRLTYDSLDWLSKLLDIAEAEPEDEMTVKQRIEVKREAEIFKIARMHTFWDEISGEGSVLLAALLEDEKDSDERGVMLELYQQCCFMNTNEFSVAFDKYQKRVLDSNKGGDA